jgi:hypothetical protein
MSNTIHCPSCQRELRVPAELVGKKVKCPSCGVIFTAGLEAEAPPEPPVVVAEAESPPEAAPPPPSRPLPREEEYYREPAQEDYARQAWERRLSRQRGLAALRPPAICLLVTGILGLTCNCFSLISVVGSDPQAMKQQFADWPQEWQRFRDIAEKSVDFSKSPAGVAYRLAFLALNLVLIISAIMMMMGKMYWLAMVGSILAMVNFETCCCLLGLPFGIWSLVVLSKAEVKSAFD